MSTNVQVQLDSNRINEFYLYCPKCRAIEPSAHAAERLRCSSLAWLLRNWECFCPPYEPRKYS